MYIYIISDRIALAVATMYNRLIMNDYESFFSRSGLAGRLGRRWVGGRRSCCGCHVTRVDPVSVVSSVDVDGGSGGGFVLESIGCL